jgi:hypothetical protein
MNGEVLCYFLFVRTSNVAATHQVILRRTTRSGLRGPYETVLADVVALELSEPRFLRLGGYRSETAHADGIECPVVIGPVVERHCFAFACQKS